MPYAQSTKVPIDRTRSEIEQVLKKAGASAFVFGWNDASAQVFFEIANRKVKFVLALPKQPGKPTPKWEQQCRSRWRGLLLCIKAKIEAVEAGIETFEEAFMPHIVLADGKTVTEHVRPWIKEIYDTGTVPKLLGPGSVQ